MAEEEKQEGQKTVVSFIAGLLIGGLLVWAFSGTPADEMQTDDTSDDSSEMVDNRPATDEDADEDTTGDTADQTDNTASTPTMEVGEGSVSLGDISATSVVLDGATFPTEDGWVGVRTYNDGEFSNILGASRYSESQGLIPESIELLTPLVSGQEYAVVFFSEDGDRMFNPAVDTQLDTEVETFTAE